MSWLSSNLPWEYLRHDYICIYSFFQVNNIKKGVVVFYLLFSSIRKKQIFFKYYYYEKHTLVVLLLNRHRVCSIYNFYEYIFVLFFFINLRLFDCKTIVMIIYLFIILALALHSIKLLFYHQYLKRIKIWIFVLDI